MPKTTNPAPRVDPARDLGRHKTTVARLISNGASRDVIAETLARKGLAPHEVQLVMAAFGPRTRGRP